MPCFCCRNESLSSGVFIMKMFQVYQGPDDDYQAVKVGFSWPAFFFGAFWALYKRMWMVALALFGVSIAFSIASHLFQGSNFLLMAVSIFSFIFGIWVGFNANGWVRSHLMKQGYQHVGTVEAGSPSAAIEAYLAEVSRKGPPPGQAA